MTENKVIIQDEVGLHARPAAVFAKRAGTFKSLITVQANGKTAAGKSILQIMSLAAKKGDTLLISAEGEDEEEAVRVLSEIACSVMPV